MSRSKLYTVISHQTVVLS